jgi:hypothetical protein
VVKTYGLKAHRPVLGEWETRDHLSIMAGLTADGRVYTLVRQEPLNGLHTVEFLEKLLPEWAGGAEPGGTGSPS